MERCTIRLKTGEARCTQLDGNVVVERLAAYEDTGLMPEEIAAHRWIPVTERLPEVGTPVLVNYIGYNDGKMHPDGVAVWTDYSCLWWEGSLEECDVEVEVPITHWMPLPKAPEVE